VPGPGRSPGFRAALALTAAAIGGLLLVPGPAAGHEEVPGVSTLFDRAVPELPAGVTVQIVRSAADQIVLANDSAEEVEVLADAGEAFLRITRSGTFANLASPTWYAVQLPEPTVVAPPPGVRAGAATPARWERVSSAPAYSWFDHRLHPAPLAAPPAAEPGVPVRLEEWRVPVRVGGRPVELLGHRQFTRLAGSVTASLDQAALQGSGLTVSVASGRVPAVVLEASGAVTAGPVVVLGREGEQMLRLTTSGVEANVASPTWALTAATRDGAAPVAAPVAAGTWQRISELPVVTWLEPRAAYQPGVPPPGVQRSATPVELERWEVPLEVAGRPFTLRGTTTWLPDPALAAAGEGDGRGWPVVPVVGAVVAVLVTSAIVVVRARRRAAGGDR
jgi:hypothetical protein